MISKMAKKRMAILYDPDAKLSPSNPLAIDKFKQAAKALNFEVEIIRTYEQYRIFEFDCLFIRETTDINNEVHSMARCAEYYGLVVIDSCKSIEIGCDKVKQYDIFTDYGISIPKTIVVNKHNIINSHKAIEHPYIIKNPYGCFSNGVFMVDTVSGYVKFCEAMLEKLDDIIVQEFIKTDFDWRIGVLDNKILFACKYYMTPGHWKVIKHNRQGDLVDGESECVPLDKVPEKILREALKAAYLVGNGLYGIDIKEVNEKPLVIEINDNPNIDAGVEDQLLGDKLYNKIILHFLEEISWNRVNQIC
jgi:glutathione synthase/RimK-type ligase-like ATP-grasp enzyme